MKIASFNHYTDGVVSSVKPNNTKEAWIFLPKESALAAGEVKTNPQEMNYSGVDAYGKEHKSATMSTNAVAAMWFPGPGGSNRVTPPNVRPGERVAIYRWGDQDQLYWTTLGMDDHLRRLETVVIGISGTPETGSNVEQDPGSMYYFEISSHKKHLLFTNSKANGEVTQYTFMANFGEGTLAIGDDLGQSVCIDSIARIVQMLNGDGSHFRMDKENITVGCKDTMLLQASKSIRIQTKDMFINTDTFTYSAKTSTLTSTGGFDFNGDVRIKGDLETSGKADFKGGATIKGIKFESHRHNTPNGMSDGPQN